MEVNETQIKEWRSHPVTQAVFKALLDEKAEAEKKQSYFETNLSMEAIAMAAAHNTGVVRGIKTVIDAIMGDNWEPADES